MSRTSIIPTVQTKANQDTDLYLSADARPLLLQDYTFKVEDQAFSPTGVLPGGFDSGFYDLNTTFTVPETGMYAIQSLVYNNELQGVTTNFGNYVQFVVESDPFDETLVARGGTIVVVPVGGGQAFLSSVRYAKFYAGVTYKLFCNLGNDRGAFYINDGVIRYSFYLIST